MDLAVTSGLRIGSIYRSACDGSSASVSYEERKRSFLDTDTLCKSEGIVFAPMVVAARGGSWGPTARNVLSRLANSAAKLTGESPSQRYEEILQTLSVILHRANARAILCRSPGPCATDPSPAIASARAALERAEIRRRAGACEAMLLDDSTLSA